MARKFDWDRIRELKRQGLSNAVITLRTGCPSDSVSRICNDEARAKKMAYSREFSRQKRLREKDLNR